MHLANTILVPRELPSPEAVLFDTSGYRPSRGRPLVCMAPREEQVGGLYMPEVVQARYQSDVGVVADPADTPDLERGMVVLIKPYTGKWMTSVDFDWIPEGRELRQLGTVDDALDNVLAVLE